MKKCTKCNETKELTSFYRDKQKQDGYYSSCIECLKARNFSPTKDSKCCARCKLEKPATEFFKSRIKSDGLQSYCKECRQNLARQRIFGCSEEQYKALQANQMNRCAICDETTNKALSVDHSHSTNQIRGLLCTRCNLGIGYFKDNIELLRKAIQYLEKTNG